MGSTEFWEVGMVWASFFIFFQLAQAQHFQVPIDLHVGPAEEQILKLLADYPSGEIIFTEDGKAKLVLRPLRGVYAIVPLPVSTAYEAMIPGNRIQLEVASYSPVQFALAEVPIWNCAREIQDSPK